MRLARLFPSVVTLSLLAGCAGAPACPAGAASDTAVAALGRHGFSARVDSEGDVAVKLKGGEVFVGPFTPIERDVMYGVFASTGRYDSRHRARLVEAAHEVSRRGFGGSAFVDTRAGGSLYTALHAVVIAPCDRLADYLPFWVDRVGQARDQLNELTKDIEPQ